jgi:hypothetical protein
MPLPSLTGFAGEHDGDAGGLELESMPPWRALVLECAPGRLEGLRARASVRGLGRWHPSRDASGGRSCRGERLGLRLALVVVELVLSCRSRWLMGKRLARLQERRTDYPSVNNPRAKS